MDADSYIDDEDLDVYYDYDDSVGIMDMFNGYENVYSRIMLLELLDTCIFPTVYQTIQSVSLLMSLSFICKLVGSFQISDLDESGVFKSFVHLTSATFGVIILYSFFDKMLIYLMVNAGFAYLVISITFYKHRPCCGLVLSLFTIGLIISLEIFIVDVASWHQIRGAQMILSMKILSLAFDISNSAIDNLPDISQYLGYVFNVGTVIFGPWISFSEYCNITRQKNRPLTLSWAWKIVQSVLLAGLCLVVSTCIVHWLILDHYWRWFLAYRDAQSFRFSHYFVSFLSEVSLTLLGLGASEVNGDIKWDLTVARPFHIELPRSLVEVVTNWNLPMHYWLKTYVFKNARPLGNFVAVLLTYAASSLLHGLNFQLAAVLVSLGFYSYVEYVFRNKLAKIFDACILAKKCKDDCGHSYKSNHHYVIATNFAFGVLSVFHLAYLGLMFDSSSQEETGYTMEHTLSKWSSLTYLSHWVAGITFLFHIFI